MKNLVAVTPLLILTLGSAAYAQTATSANPNAQTYGSQPPNIGVEQSGDKSIPYNMQPARIESPSSGTSGSGSSMPPANGTNVPSTPPSGTSGSQTNTNNNTAH